MPTRVPQGRIHYRYRYPENAYLPSRMMPFLPLATVGGAIDAAVPPVIQLLRVKT